MGDDRRALEVTQLGLTEYGDGVDLQNALHQAVLAGDIPDQLLLLEHPPVVTIGRNAGQENLRVSPAVLREQGIALERSERGGDVTFHGPGQLVGYPVLNLAADGRGARRYVNDLEEVLLRTLADFGVAARRVRGRPGVWVGERKVASLGVRILRRVSLHGFALNVAPDLAPFRLIVPCGIPDCEVASLAELCAEEVPFAAVRERVARNFGAVFSRHLVPRPLTSESVQVLVWRRRHAGETEYLLLKRTPRDGGFWQPVTGMLENGEDPREAARREVTEEVGIHGEVIDLGHARDFRISRRYVGGTDPHPWINREHAFALETGETKVCLSPEEHEAYAWVTPAKARALFVWSGNRSALELHTRRPAS
jgi:lipoyl(octanoyl) transferase